MPRHRDRTSAIAPRLGIAVLLLAAAAACRPPDAAPPDVDLERRTALRDRLQHELAEDYDAALAPPTELQRIRGPEIYDVLCSGCHGPEGGGDGPAGLRLATPPPSFTDPAVWSFFSDRARLEILRRGAPKTPMIGWETTLDEDELLAVYHFVRRLAQGRGAGEW